MNTLNLFNYSKNKSIFTKEDLLINDEDWLRHSKASLSNGTRKYTIPLFLLFWIIDLLKIPEIAHWTFLLRLVSVPITIYFIKFVNTSVTKKQFIARVHVLFFSYATLVSYILFLYNNVNYVDFSGIILVFIGAQSVFTLNRKNFFLTCLIVFLPFFATAYFFNLNHSSPSNYILYLIDCGSICVISYYTRNYLIYYQNKEYESRMALQKHIKSQEEIVKAMTDELFQARSEKLRFTIQTEKNDSMLQMAKQIAHDIRSPLSALNVAAKKISQFEPDAIKQAEYANLITLASNRIDKISQGFLDDCKSKLNTEGTHCNIYKIVSQIINEKKLAWANASIEFDISKIDQALQIQLPETELARMISNVLENSYDVIKPDVNADLKTLKPKSIHIRVESSITNDKFICLAITDNGPGIPAHVIDQIGNYGFSYNKKGGNGLGLSHAKQVLGEYNGSLTVESQPNKYTKISITCPQWRPSESA